MKIGQLHIFRDTPGVCDCKFGRSLSVVFRQIAQIAVLIAWQNNVDSSQVERRFIARNFDS